MYKNHLRRIEPPVFNPNRLNELPIPVIDPTREQIADENPALANERVAEDGYMVLGNQSLVHVFVGEAAIEDPAYGQLVQQDDGNVDLENHGLVNDEIEVKQEPELILMNEDDAEEFERILQDDDDGSDLSIDLANLSVEYEQSPTEPDELNVSVEIEFEQVDSFPKPMVCTENVLSKFEDDPISHDLAYSSKVRLNRNIHIQRFSSNQIH